MCTRVKVDFQALHDKVYSIMHNLGFDPLFAARRDAALREVGLSCQAHTRFPRCLAIDSITPHTQAHKHTRAHARTPLRAWHAVEA